MSDIEIEIDGKTLKAKPNSMIIQVADEAGIYIPRFCYHKHLSIAANCRMCLVEVEKAPKPAPACATPVMPGMKVFTRSPKALAAQRAVMEFLLINHPLDCPICDQGGECELQDLSMGYGAPDSFYTFGKRSVKDEDLGPLIASDMTRCIQCTRCVRFGDEIAGLRELGATGRGEDMEIGTYVQQAIRSEVSGNVIDICPVGALTSKPFRFTARAWELDQRPSIASHDCLGSNINVHTRYGKVMRVVPRENDAINQTWISDRDRYSYQGINHPERLAKPLIRINQEWQETDWQTALEFAAKGLHDVIQKHGTDEIGALASPSSTLEEFYLLQKIMRQLGSQNIDHRLRQVDFSDQDAIQMYPGTEIDIADLEQCDAIVLIGSNIQKEQPMLGLRVRKAALKGAKITSINMVDYRFHFPVAARKIVAPHQFVSALARIAKVLAPEQCAHFDIEVTEEDRLFAEALRNQKKSAIVLGALALNHPEASAIKTFARLIASVCNGQRVILTEGANATGAWLSGAIPHRGCGSISVDKAGLDAAAMLQHPRKGYILFNVEPELDCANPVAASRALKQADCVIALSIFKSAVLERTAHVILPIATFAETSGTFVNIEGKWQGFQGIATPYEEVRPGWKVLRVLGNFLHLDDFAYESSEAVTEEVKSQVVATTKHIQNETNNGQSTHAMRTTLNQCTENIDLSAMTFPKKNKMLSRIGEIPIYATDSLVRHAKALQETQTIVEGDQAVIRLHPKTAEQLQLKERNPVTVKQKENHICLPLVLDNRIPEGAAFIAGGIAATQNLSELFGEIEVGH
jgi:NADH-quinone oxidoreductase subunit G